jgi:hypothetical protein
MIGLRRLPAPERFFAVFLVFFPADFFMPIS